MVEEGEIQSQAGLSVLEVGEIGLSSVGGGFANEP